MRVIFSKEATLSLFGILKKYDLIENDEQVVKNIQERRHPKETMLVIIIKNFVMGKISNHQFLDALHKELKISKETTKNLAIDIMENLIPVLEKIPEGELGEYNNKKALLEKENQSKVRDAESEEENSEAAKQEAFAKAKEELYKKIGIGEPAVEPASAEGSGVAKEPLPAGQKNPDTQDVEKNAEGIKAGKSLVKDVPQARQDLAQPAPEAPPAKPDIYKENIE